MSILSTFIHIFICIVWYVFPFTLSTYFYENEIEQNDCIAFIEILPLVEFSPEDDIPDQEVERLLMAPPKIVNGTFDPFVDTMINEEISDILPLTLDRDALRALDPTTILIAKWPAPLKTKYYRNLMPEWQISMCHECLQVMKLGFFLDFHFQSN